MDQWYYTIYIKNLHITLRESDASESHLILKPYVTPLHLWNNGETIGFIKICLKQCKSGASYNTHEACSPKDFATLSRLACKPPGWSPLMLLSDGAFEAPVLDTVGTNMSPMAGVLSTVVCWLPNTAAKSSCTWLSNGFVELLLVLKPVETDKELMVRSWAFF